MAFLPIFTTIMGIILSFGYFTQTYKILKKKSAKDVSLLTYIIFGAGVTTWLIYGISISNLPLIISNIFALIGAVSVITVYFLNKH